MAHTIEIASFLLIQFFVQHLHRRLHDFYRAGVGTYLIC
jgi:hypothetical protein